MTGKGVEVWDSHRKQHRTVLPILVVAYADTPARRGWALTCGHTSRSGCDKCGLRSTRVLPNGDPISFSAFLGYDALTNGMVYDRETQVRTLSDVQALSPYFAVVYAASMHWARCRSGSLSSSSSGVAGSMTLLPWRC